MPDDSGACHILINIRTTDAANPYRGCRCAVRSFWNIGRTFGTVKKNALHPNFALDKFTTYAVASPTFNFWRNFVKVEDAVVRIAFLVESHSEILAIISIKNLFDVRGYNAFHLSLLILCLLVLAHLYHILFH